MATPSISPCSVSPITAPPQGNKERSAGVFVAVMRDRDARDRAHVRLCSSGSVDFADVVMMKVKEPLQKKHEQETGQGPTHGAVDRVQSLEAVRQQVQQADSQHDAGNEADRELHAAVRQPHQKRHPAARKRCHDAQRAVDSQ